MNRQEAEQIARDFVSSRAKAVSLPLVLLDDESVEKPYGWIFFYQSERYLQTKSVADLVLGNGPLLVSKSGEVTQLPTAIPLEEALRRYEEGLPLLPRPTTRSI